jgi:cytochrome c oxidase cbb3-type subunit III
LQPAEVDNVVDYVQALSDPDIAKQIPPTKLEAGRAVFAANCATCHGDDGKGKTEVGAPNLTDKIWIYGGDAQSILTTVRNGRQGHMPTWENRLSAVERKILALYIFGLRSPGR